MRVTAIGLLTRNPDLWGPHVKETLKFCDEYLVYQFGNCEDSAMVACSHGALMVDTPIDYLQTSDTGTGLTTLYQEALSRGSGAVFMADPTEKFVGDPKTAVGMLYDVEVVYSKMFRARVTEQDDGRSVFEHKYFEPEYNKKVTFCQCRPGRLFWAMYPFWPYGALSMAEYGIVKGYALAHSKEAFRVLTVGSANEYAEMTPELEAKAEDWVAHGMKSRDGNDLITEDEFGRKGVLLA